MLVGFTQSPLRCFLCQVQSLTNLPFTPLSLPLFPVGDALARSSAARSSATSASVCQVFVVRSPSTGAQQVCSPLLVLPALRNRAPKPYSKLLASGSGTVTSVHMYCARGACVCVFFMGGWGYVSRLYFESAVYL
jgi:hypothetical protein